MLKKTAPNDMPLMATAPGNIVLFHPFIPEEAKAEVLDTLNTRWIGQGPKVASFEKLFTEKEADGHPSVAVGSGTDALHLAYRLCGLDNKSEVIAPLFTCTATNIPLLYEHAKIKFVDIEPKSMNMDVTAIEPLINERTKAIVVVHFGGYPCNLDELSRIERQYGIPVIQDGAHAFGLRWRSRPMAHWTRFTMYSFQAIKHITTGDGGMLVVNASDPEIVKAARRIRWFGIDREKKQGGIWENDIVEVGYKYQMTDLGACVGLAGLRHSDGLMSHRRRLWPFMSKVLRTYRGSSISPARRKGLMKLTSMPPGSARYWPNAERICSGSFTKKALRVVRFTIVTTATPSSRRALRGRPSQIWTRSKTIISPFRCITSLRRRTSPISAIRSGRAGSSAPLFGFETRRSSFSLSHSVVAGQVAAVNERTLRMMS